LRYTLAPVSIILLACSLHGAAQAAPPCTKENKEAAWNLLQTKAPSKSPEELARNVEAFRAECGLPLWFWPGPKAEASQKIEHPCGESVEAFVRTIPSPSDQVTQSEEAFELGSAGEIIQRWWIPIDSTVVGIAGDELLITQALGEEGNFLVQLAISPRGQFRAIPLSTSSPGTSISCPKNQDLPQSDYMGCWRFLDKSSGAERRLVYEDICS
jgi:hypothetical protein